MDAIFNRLKEPSTYAGIAALAALIGLKVTPEGWQGVVSLISIIPAILAVVLPEQKA